MLKATLLIDQGNTRLKWMLAREDELLLESAGRGDLSAFVRACQELESPESVLVSSVVGNVAGKADSRVGARLAGDDPLMDLIEFCHSCWAIEPRLLRSVEQGSEVLNGYEQPGTLGVDRWLAITGAVGRYGKPVVIWDLGTASTLDAVNSSGQHLGGMIYPGPATMLRALDRDTRLRVPEHLAGAAIAPGRSTASCITNGVFAAQLGALNQFLRHVTESLGGEPKLIVTGGAAGEILPMLDFEHIHDPWLVFRGMLTEGIRYRPHMV